MEEVDAKNQVPIAKSNFRLGLTVLYKDLDYLADELAKAVETPDALDALISKLQGRYEELRKANPNLEL